MRRSGRVVAQTLEALREAIRPGVSTLQLDRLAEQRIRREGAVPSFLGYRGYPATICAEIGDIVVHGIPDETRLESGAIIGIDLGAHMDGFHADAAVTIAIGEVSPEMLRLLRVSEEALYLGIEQARAGRRLGQLCAAIQSHVEQNGFSVVRELVGHGIGRQMHEAPQVPNFVDERSISEYSLVLRPGMTLAIEPMVNMGEAAVVQDSDGWTVRTADGKPSAHFEHTVAVTRDGAEVLTRL